MLHDVFTLCESRIAAVGVTARPLQLRNGVVFFSTSVRGVPPVLHSTVAKVIDTVPLGARGAGHGKCGLAVCLSNALFARLDPSGATAAAYMIRNNVLHSKHGMQMDACASCKPLVEYFNLDFLTKWGK